ncbi:RNA polymerase III subunit RPC82-domain-containing protein [Delphinella strobiligena]|nr:RNA polymerase III subunit RPC82-domain-containing protein [Delphinella strobiligena]
MAQQHAQLCTLLIQDTYGELCAQVFKTLSDWGRLNLSSLIQQCQLSPKHVRHGLAVLIQYHLVHHCPASENDDQAFYDVDWNGAYNIMRAGKIIQIVEERFGEGAGQAVSNLLQFGHARVGDLEDAYKFDSKTSGAVNSIAEHINGEDEVNGVHRPQDKKITSKAQLHSTLYQLLKSGFIVRVNRQTYLTPADARNEAETVVKREQFPDGKVSGPKASAAFNQAVNTLKRKWRDEADDNNSGVKRTAATNGHGPSAKRQRTNNGTANGVGKYGDEEDDIITLERDMVIKVNYEKCNVALRSQALERLAARSIGEVTSKVYGALLQLLERKMPRCYDDVEEYVDEQDEEAAQPASTTLDIADLLPPSIDLTTTIAKDDDVLHGDEIYDIDDPIAPPVKREHATTNGYGHDASASSFADRNKRLTQIEQHMALLAEHPRNFVSKISTRGKGEWRVNFPALSRWMQRNEIESVISARFGSIATRIVRMLNAKGKLDEKQVANFTLMRQKDIRSILAEMHEAGFLEAQEVPKDNSRQPSRTLFLWFFDPERCRQLLLSTTYKAQARLIQRMQFEKDEVLPVVQKAERLDVVGHEEEFLTSSDKATLRRWREFEEKLLTQMARQDDLVALMRDFLGEQKVA